MKLKEKILCIFLFVISILKAQTNFQSGFIIKINGDTLWGSINYRDDLFLYENCMFKFKDSSEKIKYSPSEIIGYRFKNSKYFFSKSFYDKKVFMEVLFKGKVNIYYFRDEKGEHYFIEKDSIGLTELIYDEFNRTIDNQFGLYQSKKHIGVLLYYMQDAYDFQSRIIKIVKLEHKSLIKLAKDYHIRTCHNNEYSIYEKKAPFIKIRIETIWGLKKYYRYDKFINEFGGNFYLGFPFTSDKFSFKTGFLLHRISADNNNLHSICKIPLQFQFLYSLKKISPFISLGINNYFLEWKKKYDFLKKENKSVNIALSINSGINYKINNFINLNSSLNFDYCPKTLLVEQLRINANTTTTQNYYFNLTSYSFNIGININF